MGLGKYFHKRKFKETPEPKGEVKKSRSHRLAFVVQEHHASQLHYDFRLELDGVLKSWAVPKGPSLDPRQHHLAVQTEDHPFEYRTFEGVIPKGNYGAGNVIIWDEGWYEVRTGSPADNEKTVRAGLKQGHLTFVLHGTKLRGEFALIKMPHASEDNAWLLIKKGDQYATGSDVTTNDESVITHRRVDDLGGKMPDLSPYPKKIKPWRVTPMLCTLVDQPFSHEDWLFEIKWDGYRAIGSKYKGNIELYSRNALDFTAKYAPVTEAMRAFEHDVIVDGEIVVVDADGVAHFEWLQGYGTSVAAQRKNPDLAEPKGELHYYIFDILWCDGHDVRTMPLHARKTLLTYVLPDHPALRYSDDIEAKGEALFAKMAERGMEGMVAKKADGTYHEGERGQDWLKVKTGLRQEVVIAGYTEPRGSRKYFGSLLTGVYGWDGKLHYVGHSGGGIADDERKILLARMQRLERKSSPFAAEPKPNAPAHWLRPELVGEMSFSEWTDEGYMRHPQFEGLRSDKNPKTVRKEKTKATVVAKGQSSPQSSPLPVRRTRVSRVTEARFLRAEGSREQEEGLTALPFTPTHLDKVFFPAKRYTKGDLFDYYTMAAPYILPYLQDRPCSLLRMPNGISGEGFFQKNHEHLPSWVPHKDIFSDSNNAHLRWIVGGDLPTLLYMVQLGCVEINPWNSRVGHLHKPDWIVIDLDPEGVSFERVIEAAQMVKTVCDHWHIPTYPKTSGKTGLHIYIPMGAKYTYEQAKNLAHLIALEVNARLPKITSVERMPAKRKNKIYLDFLQNREGQTLAAPYSVRPTADASVAMPLHWTEVVSGLKPSDFTIKNAADRLRLQGDIWQPVLGKPIDLATVLERIQALH